MARGRSKTKQYSNLEKDLDDEASADNKDQTEVYQTKDSTGEGTSKYDDSFDSNYDEEIPMKKQGSGKVYDSTPAKRGSRKPKDPAYTAKKNPKDLYTKKCDDSSNKENQSKGKKKDAGKDSSDPTDSGDNGDDDSSEDDEEKVTNPDDAWTFFQEACKLTAECNEDFGNLGYHTVDYLEILGSATPVDIVIMTSTTITHATVTRIAIFTKFLYLRGYFKRNATLPLMARHNNKTKQPDTNDGGSEDDNSGKGLLRPGTSPIIPHFSNNIEEFEAFWAKLEIKLKQSCLGQHMERAPTNKKGKSFQEILLYIGS